MESGSGERGEMLDMAELSRAVMATEAEPTVVDFAPPNNPQRIQRVAELTGASIRLGEPAQMQAVRSSNLSTRRTPL